MKKKFSLWVNLAVICLCVCSIAIGVYAATSATLTVSGQIGFQAHECEVDVSGAIYGHATDSTLKTVHPSDDPVNIIMDSDEGDAQYTGRVGGEEPSVKSPIDIDELYFTDLVDPMPNIVVSLTVTNQSPYKVAATVTVSDVANVAYLRKYTHGETNGTHEGAVILDANGGENDDVTFEIELNVANKIKDVTLSDLNISANFAKYVEMDAGFIDLETTPGLGYILNENSDSWTVGAFVFDEESGEYLPIAEIATGDGIEVPGLAENLVIPAFVKGLPVTHVKSGGFYEVTNLQSVVIPNTVVALGEKINGGAFYLCKNLSSVTLPNSITYIESQAFSETALTNVVIPQSIDILESYLFEVCEQLTSITLPYGLEKIYDGVFAGCDSLTKLTIPATVTYLSAEEFNYNLTEITFEGEVPPAEGIDDVDSGKSWFGGCDNLQAIYVPSESAKIAFLELLTPYAEADGLDYSTLIKVK